MFDFSNYSSESKYYDDSNKLVAGNIKYEIGLLDCSQRCAHS